MIYFIILLISAAAIFWIATGNKRKARKRESIASVPFPSEWRQILRKNLPFFYKMPSDLQLQLKNKMQIFLYEKQFVGRKGQEINDEVRVTIAAQACLLLLNRNTDFYPFLQTIVVYPAAFITRHAQYDSSGVKTQDARVLLGESWTRGQVVLSWRDSASGGADFDDGHNLVIHEFAHQIDGESGVTNGAPTLSKEQSYDDWSKVLSKEFERLQMQARTGADSFLDKYGATNPAEFFAVCSEVFFEKPKELKAIHNDLFKQLKAFYQVDPSQW